MLQTRMYGEDYVLPSILRSYCP